MGKKLRDYYDDHGPTKVPADTFGLWTLIRDSLDPRHERDQIKEQMSPVLKTESVHEYDESEAARVVPSAPLMPPPPFDSIFTDDGEEAARYYSPDENSAPLVAIGGVAQPAVPDNIRREIDQLERQLKQLTVQINRKQGGDKLLQLPPMDTQSKNLTPEDFSHPLHPTVIAGVDPPPVKFKGLNSEGQLIPALKVPYSETGLQKGLRIAAANGDNIGDFKMAFPVIDQHDQQGQSTRGHEPLPFKVLKELKTACAQYGATAPFTLAQVEGLTASALTPWDWRIVARACLPGGDFLLWDTSFREHCERTAKLNKGANNGITYDMLAGEGPYKENVNQLTYPAGAYAQINTAAKEAWKSLPCSNRKTEELSKIRQGPDEPFQDFVDRLLNAAGRLISDPEAETILVKILAYENANSACQAAIRPFKRKGDLKDYIRLCSDIGPSYTQGIAIAAALQGKSIKQVLTDPVLIWGRGHVCVFPQGADGARWLPERLVQHAENEHRDYSSDGNTD
ncbi:LOW QUALITY PROTEIN: endogenous retrovirus group K member 5 Gag polyprotein-like [Pteropus alecto]|uniref:LOW QUALITY PROTEIN: endogenous retrovirus group K member 5 Gag polyprotein-like n=1 Tax=Pteropus alecto TaxID=9402 RepID=UPI000768920E|nr:LOW QUALITY PROTEIN: endogenous retrovirus group K member 5 Gag polyprotein-like [Pteropus alecto]